MKSNKFLLVVFAIGLTLTLLGLVFIRVEITSNAMGVVQHKHETILHAPRSGAMGEINFTVGQSVKKGDIILTLEDPDLELEIIQLKRSIINQKNKLQQDRINAQINHITGHMPELQNIEETISAQKKLMQLSQLLTNNNNLSLQRDLISKKQFYEESMERIREEIDLLKNNQLLLWKNSGLQNVLERKDITQIENIEKMVTAMENQLSLLYKEKKKLSIKSTLNGIIIDFYFRYDSQHLEQGMKIVKIADHLSGYQVKAYIPEKNIDMVDVGMKVRMESMVYHSQLEGYLHGTISRITNPRNIFSPEDVQNSFFETLVDIEQYPYPPVHGSRVKMEIIIGKGNLISALINRPISSRGNQ